jgi:hypothetical protein
MGNHALPFPEGFPWRRDRRREKSRPAMPDLIEIVSDPFLPAWHGNNFMQRLQQQVIMNNRSQSAPAMTKIRHALKHGNLRFSRSHGRPVFSVQKNSSGRPASRPLL